MSLIFILKLTFELSKWSLILHVSVSFRSTMPRPRQPDTLENTCIRCVAYHELIWGREELTRLPACFIEKLLDGVLEGMEGAGEGRVWQTFLRSAFFGVKINRVRYQPWRNVSSFYLTSSNTDSSRQGPLPPRCDVENAFARFLQSSKHLVDIDLHIDFMPFWHHDFSTLGGVFHLLNGCDLSELAVLNMKGMRFCENTMEILANNCPRLQELRLEDCTCVNDDMIKLLIKKSDDGSSVLKHLKVLDVRRTNISQKGVRHILECIPTITHLYHPEVLPVALQLLQCGALTPPLHLEWLKLSGLDELINYVEHKDDILIDGAAFSNVTNVTIILENSTEAAQLKAFSPIKNLRELKIMRQSSHSYLFEPHISKLIQNTGGNLYTLCLEDVAYISFSTIGKSCPNLRRFDAHFLSVQSDIHEAVFQSYFQNVEVLCLHEADEMPSDYVIHPEIEQIILDLISPMHKLISLKLKTIAISDTFLFSLLSRNPLTLIESIELDNCYMMADDIVPFIGQCAKLRKLSVGYSLPESSSDRSDFYCQFTTLPESFLAGELEYRGWDVELSLEADCIDYEMYPSRYFSTSSDDEWNWSKSKMFHIRSRVDR